MPNATPDRRNAGDRMRAAERWTVRLVPLWGLAAGLVAGAALGALARLWMRLIATEPEFTWDGTLFIIGAFAVAGAMVGPVLGARRRAWTGGPMSGLRLVGCAATLPLCVGQGAVLAPTLVLGALALARRSWPTWARAVLGLVAAMPLMAVHLLLRDDWPHSWVRMVAAVALGGAVYLGAVLALAQAYAPAPGARLPGAARLGFLGIPVAAVTLVGVPNAVEPGPARVLLGGVAVVVVIGAARRRHRPSLTDGPTPAPAGVAGGPTP